MPRQIFMLATPLLLKQLNLILICYVIIVGIKTHGSELHGQEEQPICVITTEILFAHSS